MSAIETLRGPQPWVLCCHCFESYPRCAMTPVDDEPGQVWDVCRNCTAIEAFIMRTHWCQVARPHAEHGVCTGYPRPLDQAVA